MLIPTVCECGNPRCFECRLARQRKYARERQRRRRALCQVVEHDTPLFDCTERNDWIDVVLRLGDIRRRRLSHGWRG